MDDSLCLDKIAEVEKLKIGNTKEFWIGFAFFFHEKLDVAKVIANFDKGELTERTNSDDATSNNDLLAVFFVKMIDDVGNLGVAIALGWIWIDTLSLDFF